MTRHSILTIAEAPTSTEATNSFAAGRMIPEMAHQEPERRDDQEQREGHPRKLKALHQDGGAEKKGRKQEPVERNPSASPGPGSGRGQAPIETRRGSARSRRSARRKPGKRGSPSMERAAAVSRRACRRGLRKDLAVPARSAPQSRGDEPATRISKDPCRTKFFICTYWTPFLVGREPRGRQSVTTRPRAPRGRQRERDSHRGFSSFHSCSVQQSRAAVRQPAALVEELPQAGVGARVVDLARSACRTSPGQLPVQ